MEPITKRRMLATIVWDEEHVKALLHFPRFPVRLIQQEPWQSWIGERGGLKAINAYLLSYPFPPSHRRILDVVLSNPESVAGVYADRLSISRATYFYQLRELVTAIAQALNHWDLDANPVLETTLPFQSNLPTPLTSLIGVETPLHSLTHLLLRKDIRLLTLLGPGGIGKTRLSIEIARRAAQEVCFVDLSALHNSSKIIPAIAQNLGVKKDITIQGVKSALKAREFLLILDNFEQILPARSLISDLLAGLPLLKIIVTSRAALHVYGENEFIVPPLAIADIESVKGQQLWAQSPAVALFVQRAQSVNPNFSLNNENVEAITELCQRMEGIPLAIELAAYQIKYFSPQAMLNLSRNRLDFLSQDSQRMPPHQQTMRIMLDWSFNLLSPDLQILFCRLSAFPDSFTISEARSICALENIQPGLTALVDQSLLEQHPCTDEEPRFQMLSMIREYAHERLNKMEKIT